MTTAPGTTPTLSDQAREVFRLLFDERDLSDPTRYWSDRSVDHFLAAGVSVTGADALARWFTDLFAAVPDWTMELENVLDDGANQVVVQWHATGTFTGAPFLGIEPTGRAIDLRGVDVMVLDTAGKIDTNTIYYDGAEFARQVGMLPRRDSTADRLLLRAFNAGTKARRAISRSR